MTELPTTYDPAGIEPGIMKRWLEAEAFAATPDDREQRYVVMMPLPNVTGALHMGHAMDNVMQDLLVRWHRMRGANTLWQPGTDHAGIATQAVVEKRLRDEEGKTRHDLGREALVERIWAWKDEYQARIMSQQQQMGCSCDWDRQRFTMDAVCSAAVRETFFRLFRDKLIFRGDRLVNWDCFLQTAVANDEVEHRTVQGHFWHLRYPIVDAAEGETDHVIVATTRPETMLGDTAVACHPEPRKALERLLEKAREKLADPKANSEDAKAEIARLEARITDVLPRLEQLARMAAAGRTIELPLLGRKIPLISDEWAKPELGSGCVKITPAHDPNDYAVWERHKERIETINLLLPDGTYNDNAGPYAGLDRFEVRTKVVADLDAQGLLLQVEERETEIGHSDRSKTPIEPYLSKQWFVRMGDVDGGVTFGKGTPKQFTGAGLAQAAIDAAGGSWSSASGRQVDFHPDSERYRRGYTSWLGEKRDWCISRQLWWGHRIPVWWRRFEDRAELAAVAAKLPTDERAWVWISDDDGAQHPRDVDLGTLPEGPLELQVCLQAETDDATHGAALEALGLERDPDVLDTWFSSALWPFSTLGWPDPANAPILDGQRALGGEPSSLDYYYPGSCLVTGRDILTLWVARMVIMGLYNLGDVPFTDVFLHAKILDGKGVTMSKSKGNGIDPVDVINEYGTDAMRYLICHMQTGTQDIRLPVQATCPHCEKIVELADADHGTTADGHVNLFTYTCTHKGCKQEFDVGGKTKDLPTAKITSTRFEPGRNFCTKMWNATRFALMNLGEASFTPLKHAELSPEDRWILSRLSATAAEVHTQLEGYNPSLAQQAARAFFWNDLCDWYLELIKPRMKDGDPAAAQVLVTCLDQALRLLHPFMPFITEALWAKLREQAPQRGIDAPLTDSELLIRAAYPELPAAWVDATLEQDFAGMQDLVKALRNLRKENGVSPGKPLEARIKAPAETAASLERMAATIQLSSNLSQLAIGPDVEPPANAATAVVGECEAYLGDVLDPEKERARLSKLEQDLTKRLTGSQKKLSNQGFVAKAPPQVVEAERAKVAELEAQLTSVKESLAALG